MFPVSVIFLVVRRCFLVFLMWMSLHLLISVLRNKSIHRGSFIRYWFDFLILSFMFWRGLFAAALLCRASSPGALSFIHRQFLEIILRLWLF